MASFEKYKRIQIGHLFSHNSGIATPKDKHIDNNLNYLNYNLLNRDINYLNNRLEVLQCSKRKDINIVSELIVTLPKSFSGSEEQFFESVFNFSKLKYKEDNLIYARVHYNEPKAQPHIHIMFIPTIYDRKKKKVSVSYDKCVYQNLNKFHKELSNYMEKQFGYDVGIINGATKEGNKTIDQLKKETELRKEIEELQEEKEILLDEIEETLNLDSKIIISKYKAENEKLKIENNILRYFLQKFNLWDKFKRWYKNLSENKEKTIVK